MKQLSYTTSFNSDGTSNPDVPADSLLFVGSGFPQNSSILITAINGQNLQKLNTLADKTGNFTFQAEFTDPSIKANLSLLGEGGSWTDAAKEWVIPFPDNTQIVVGIS